ncbi:hypothetical protein KUF71_021329, partial [Frankliniella fusca]
NLTQSSFQPGPVGVDAPRGYVGKAAAIVVGSLGTWDPANDEVLKMLRIPPQKFKNLKRKCVSDTIRWSRDMYVEHRATGVRSRLQLSIPIAFSIANTPGVSPPTPANNNNKKKNITMFTTLCIAKLCIVLTKLLLKLT